MGLLDRLWRRRNEPVGSRSAQAVTVTDIDALMDAALDGGEVNGRYFMTPEGAMHQATVFRCVALISGAVASLPLHLYRRVQPRGKERVPADPRYQLLHSSPNERDTAFEFRELVQAHQLLRGNAYAQKVYDRAGRLRELWPLHPDRMSVWQEDDGSLRYLYRRDRGQPVAFTADEVVHWRGLGSDGIVGYSVVSLAAGAIRMAALGETFGSSFLANYARVPVVLETQKTFRDAEKMERLRKQWDEIYRGANNAGKTAILEDGLSAKSIGMTADDAQFLQTRSFQRTEVCMWFGVLPFLIGDTEKATSWGTGIESQKIGFYQFTLLGWLERTEQRDDLALLEREERGEYFYEHEVSGFLRGDQVARYQSYATGRQWGWLSADDVRELENMNPLPNGQGSRYLEPSNMTSPGGSAPARGGAAALPAAATGGAFVPLLEATWRRIVRRWVQDLPSALRGGQEAVDALRREHEVWGLSELLPVLLAGGWSAEARRRAWEVTSTRLHEREGEMDVERSARALALATLEVLEGVGDA